MKKYTPKISVIMSVFNEERYLKKSIESILNQTFKDFEFLIINDGSTDRTAVILKEYGRKDERIKVINNSVNIGLTRSLNKAIQLSKGKYIARMDANDISLSERLEKQFNFMEGNPDIGLVSTYTQFIDEMDQYLNHINRPEKEMSLKRLFFDSQICHSSIMIRKNILEKVGYYDERFIYSQDTDLILRIGRISKIAAIPEILVLWRCSKQSISAKKKIAQVKFEILAYAKAVRENLYPKYYYLFFPIFFIKIFIPNFLKKFLRATILKRL